MCGIPILLRLLVQSVGLLTQVFNLFVVMLSLNQKRMNLLEEVVSLDLVRLGLSRGILRLMLVLGGRDVHCSAWCRCSVVAMCACSA